MKTMMNTIKIILLDVKCQRNVQRDPSLKKLHYENLQHKYKYFALRGNGSKRVKG